ncbi:uncharacterized protein LOC129919377 [Episyrphus balteatus]|uniref:uncharacterized protein LOC129919377 n=1 Tax=Episyrphus balteatus TaxID=286459 RepID=UPI002486C13E|nr:uncharacterized protein LOC129919377 [Episyrphus balteatus]
MDITILICLILGTFFTNIASAEKILRYMPTEYKLWSDNVVLNYTFSMDPNVPYVNVTAKVLQEIKQLDIHATGAIVGKNDPSYFFSYNTTYSVCDLLAWKSSSPIGMFVFQYIKEYGSLPDSCPIAKGEYGFHNIWLPEDPLTATLPEIDFNVNIQAIATTVDGSAVKKVILNDFWKGEGRVIDVPTVKKSVLSYIPKVSAMG